MVAPVSSSHLDAVYPAAVIAAMEDRVWSRVAGGDVSTCWVWTGPLAAGGYARVNMFRRSYAVHRLTYRTLRCDIPDGLQMDHLCRNRACCNPWHLEPVTARVNSLRGVGETAVNAQKDCCSKGHAYTEENTRRYLGRRYCRQCQLSYADARRDEVNALRRSRSKKAQGLPRKRPAPVTECKYGHPFDEANTYVKPNGSRSCRACMRRIDAARRAERDRIAEWRRRAER